jgi:PST family polysaccharide transporter
VLNASALGYYTLASRLAAMPVQVIGNVLGRGVFAALSRLQDDRMAFRRVWLENVQRVALLAIPATIAIVVVAEPFVVAVLGEKWRPGILALQILALNGIVRTFAATSGEVFQALHRPQLRVYAEAVHLTLIVPALVVGARLDGIEGAAAAVVLVNVATGVPVVLVVMRLLDVNLRELGAAIVRPAVGWVLMAATLLAVRPFVEELSSGVALIALVAAGGAVYAAAVALFARDIVTTMWLSLRGVRTSS